MVTSAAMNGRPSPTTMHWLDQRVGAQPVLEHRRGDVLAAGGDQDLLLAPGDPDEALVVDLADVAGVEPAVGARAPRRWPPRCASSRRRPGRPGTAARRPRRPAPRCRGAGRPTVPIFWRVGQVDGQGGSGLGEAVALEDVDADAAVEVAEPVAERRAAGDGVGAPAAERRRAAWRRPAVEQRVLGADRQRDRPGLEARATRRSRRRPRGRRSCPRPSAVARWLAVLKTFSKTRGTARMKVGLNARGRRRRFLMSALWPSRTRALTQPTWMIRAKTWASGRNSSVRPRPRRRGEQLVAARATATPSSNMKLPWVSMQPLGRPVVPEV